MPDPLNSLTALLSLLWFAGLLTWAQCASTLP